MYDIKLEYSVMTPLIKCTSSVCSGVQQYVFQTLNFASVRIRSILYRSIAPQNRKYSSTCFEICIPVCHV